MSLSWLGSRCHPKVHEKCLHEFETWTRRISSAPSVQRASSSGISLTGVFTSQQACFHPWTCSHPLSSGGTSGLLLRPVYVEGSGSQHRVHAHARSSGTLSRGFHAQRPQDELQDRGGERSAQSQRASRNIGLMENSVFFLGEHKLRRLFFSLSICSGHFWHSFIAF